MEECNETGMVIVLKNAITRQMIFGTSDQKPPGGFRPDRYVRETARMARRSRHVQIFFEFWYSVSGVTKIFLISVINFYYIINKLIILVLGLH
jgi:hypothetical protein